MHLSHRLRSAFLYALACLGIFMIVLSGFALFWLSEGGSLWQAFLLIGALLILTAAFGILSGWILAGKVLAPLNDMITFVEKTSSRNLSEKFPAASGNDEIARLSRAFNEMLDRFEQALSQARQFSDDASHELRTPLAIMRAELENSLAGNASAQKLRRIVASTLDEVIRMSEIVESLLILSRIDRGTIELPREQVKLDEMIYSLYQETIILAAQRLITVVLRGAANVTVYGDPLQLRQLFLNLIDNAIKYNHEHGKIYLSLERGDGFAIVTVQDTGVGIAEEDLHRVFDRFYRGEIGRSRDPQGIGLGLSIARWIAEAHGGKIEVSSEPGKGTTFKVLLPVEARISP